MFNDKLQNSLKGTLIFSYYRNNDLIKQEKEENVVVDQSRTFMRDLVSGNSDPVITELKIGDMNKTLSDDCSNPGEPSTTDTDLVNTFFTKGFSDKQLLDDDGNGNPAIKYTFEILENEANDPSNSDNERKLWCEYALADASNRIWTRKIKPVIKDNETKIVIDYILSF